LTAAGIDLPFPTTQVLFHDQTEETDGDRARQREGWPADQGDAPRSRWQVLRAEAKPTTLSPAGERR
jgi:small conductance mechanosensitive channel